MAARLKLRAVDAVVSHVLRGDTQELSDAAVEAAKTFILDSLGVALSGTRVALLADVKAVVSEWGSGDAARVWGTGERVPVASAAFVNSWQIHNQEFDCVHEGAVVHPMAVILATLLAYADSRGGISGARLLQACSIGVDVAVTIGGAARNRLRFFRPAMCGAFGAVAGIGLLERFDADTLTSALGLAYSQLSGTMQAHVEGSAILPMQIGFNARAALTAIALAARGLVGPRDFLEGPFGYFRLMDDEPDFSPFETMATSARITELSHKPFPSGRATHGAVDGVLSLLTANGLTARDVRAARIVAPPLVLQLVDRRAQASMSPAYARLCLPYVTATAMLRGTVDVIDFDPAALADAARLELAERIRVLPDSNTDLNALAPQRVEIETRDGGSLAIALPAVLGSPLRPLSRQRQLEKFRAACRSASVVFSDARIDQIEGTIEHLDVLPDARLLIDLLVAEPR